MSKVSLFITLNLQIIMIPYALWLVTCSFIWIVISEQPVCQNALNGECIATFVNQDIDINASAGAIKGRIVAVAGTTGLAAEFLGIPYAEPPINELRFQDPVPKTKWNGVFEAFQFGNSCMQKNRIADIFNNNWLKNFNPPGVISEDCLYINVWAPYPLPTKASVMVWIHGGAFYAGNSATAWYNGKTLSRHNDVIVVSLNYRLGAFGFLASGDNRIKGNFGLKDQIQALKWIQENIASFGGDPNSVTLFGESAGSACVGYHLLSPLSQNLFKRGIMQSGIPISNWAYMPTELAQRRFIEFLGHINCPNDDTAVKCLSQLTPDEIIAKQFVVDPQQNIPWFPVIDGEFLLDTPLHLLKSGQLKRSNVLLGVNKDEATLLLVMHVQLNPEYINSKSIEEYFNIIEIITADYSPEIKEVVKFFYADWISSNLTQNHFDHLNKIFSDRNFICPAVQWSHYANEFGNDVFLYHLSHRSSVEEWPEWLGVIHTAEIHWVFGMPLNRSLGYTDDERQLSKTLMSYWSNFAKYGDPIAKKTSPHLPAWPKFRKSRPNYLEISSCNKFTVETSLRSQYCALWNELLPNLQNILKNREL